MGCGVSRVEETTSQQSSPEPARSGPTSGSRQVPNAAVTESAVTESDESPMVQSESIARRTQNIKFDTEEPKVNVCQKERIKSNTPESPPSISRIASKKWDKDSGPRLLQDGRISVSAGKLDEAEMLFRQSLEANEHFLGSSHPETLVSCSSLAAVLLSRDRPEDAELLCRKSLAGREETLGSDDLDTLSAVNGLAALLHIQGKYDEAETLYRRALQGRKKILGAEDPDTIASLSSLSSLLYASKKYEEMEPICQQVVMLREKLLGHDHHETLSALSSLSALLYAQGKFSESETLLRRVLKGRTRVLGPDHPDTRSTQQQLDCLLKAQNRVSEPVSLPKEEDQKSKPKRSSLPPIDGFHALPRIDVLTPGTQGSTSLEPPKGAQPVRHGHLEALQQPLKANS